LDVNTFTWTACWMNSTISVNNTMCPLLQELPAGKYVKYLVYVTLAVLWFLSCDPQFAGIEDKILGVPVTAVACFWWCHFWTHLGVGMLAQKIVGALAQSWFIMAFGLIFSQIASFLAWDLVLWRLANAEPGVFFTYLCILTSSSVSQATEWAYKPETIIFLGHHPLVLGIPNFLLGFVKSVVQRRFCEKIGCTTPTADYKMGYSELVAPLKNLYAEKPPLLDPLMNFGLSAGRPPRRQRRPAIEPLMA